MALSKGSALLSCPPTSRHGISLIFGASYPLFFRASSQDGDPDKCSSLPLFVSHVLNTVSQSLASLLSPEVAPSSAPALGLQPASSVSEELVPKRDGVLVYVLI